MIVKIYYMQIYSPLVIPQVSVFIRASIKNNIKNACIKY